MADVPPSVHLRRAIIAHSPITYHAADNSIVQTLATATKINLGNGLIFDKSGAHGTCVIIIPSLASVETLPLEPIPCLRQLPDASDLSLPPFFVLLLSPSSNVDPKAHPSTITLPVLLVAYKAREATLSDYLRETRANGVGLVPTERRGFITDWLAGRGEELGKFCFT